MVTWILIQCISDLWSLGSVDDVMVSIWSQRTQTLPVSGTLERFLKYFVHCGLLTQGKISMNTDFEQSPHSYCADTIHTLQKFT